MKMNRLMKQTGFQIILLFGLFLFPAATQANQSHRSTIEENAQSEITVKGVVTDASSGEALIGVSVVVKNTTIGASTDLDGAYTIKVPEDAILVFSYVGFITHEIKVNGKTTIDVKLKEDARSLEEVVVVGYTTQKKADLTGAVASVKMSNLNDMSTSSINSALQGRMSGVTVLQSSGAPGSGTSIRVRGMGTFGNNDPLYIIEPAIFIWTN